MFEGASVVEGGDDVEEIEKLFAIAEAQEPIGGRRIYYIINPACN